jgi:hypothetical protein
MVGFPWLYKYNLIINWKKEEITFKPFQIDWRPLIKKGKQIRQEQQPKIEEVVDVLSRHVPTMANPKVCQLTSTVLGWLCSSALRRAAQ